MIVKIFLASYILLCVLSAKAIRVDYGTNTGPIVPRPPQPSIEPPKEPYRTPAPVWENRNDDLDDPNATWRPPKFIPHGPFNYNVTPTTQEQPILTNAQRFVNQYRPTQVTNVQQTQAQPSTNVPVQQTPMFRPAPGVQKMYTRIVIPQLTAVPSSGFGLRYFLPTYYNADMKPREAEKEFNGIENNDVYDNHREYSNDKDLIKEKYVSSRQSRSSLEGSQTQPNSFVYQWPLSVIQLN